MKPLHEKCQKDSRILRWDHKTSLSKHSPENYGKKITDENPYLELDIEKFDLYSELYPVEELLEVMNDDIRFLKNVEIENLQNCTGKKLPYLPRITKDILRMKLEERKIRKPRVNADRTKSLNELKEEIIAFAKQRNVVCGFTLLDRRYIADGKDERFPYKTILMLGMEMDKEQVLEIPNPGWKTRENHSYYIYEKLGKVTHEIADFIRQSGYACMTRVSIDGALKYPPHAVNAGMGNYGTHGLVLTKQFGSRIRFSAINIDADIPIDSPKDINIEEFCKRCRLCQKVCPEESIPKEAAEWRGAIKRKANSKKCINSFKERSMCSYCLKVCPISTFGYEVCMDTIPKYYHYNTMENVVDKNMLSYYYANYSKKDTESD